MSLSKDDGKELRIPSMKSGFHLEVFYSFTVPHLLRHDLLHLCESRGGSGLLFVYLLSVSGREGTRKPSSSGGRESLSSRGGMGSGRNVCGGTLFYDSDVLGPIDPRLATLTPNLTENN